MKRHRHGDYVDAIRQRLFESEFVRDARIEITGIEPIGNPDDRRVRVAWTIRRGAEHRDEVREYRVADLIENDSGDGTPESVATAIWVDVIGG